VRGVRYAWVTFSSPAATAEALKKDGQPLDERPLSIKPYQVAPPKAQRAPRPPRDAAVPAKPTTARKAAPLAVADAAPVEVSIVGLPDELQEDSIRSIFTKYGGVTSVQVNKLLGKTLRATVVTFDSPEAASASLQLDKASVNGKEVSVRLLRARRAPTTAAAGRSLPAKAVSAPAAEAVIIPDSVAVLGLRGVAPEQIAEHFSGCGEIDSIRFVFRGCVHCCCG
jgi:RNA recognition motif. (a.k.a. RRM, RBD, or RNP domain)